MKYIHELGELFEAVQMGAIFPDGKTFPDCLPKANLESIAEQYEIEKKLTGFDLKSFIAKYFEEPPVVGNDFKSDPSRSPEQHIEALWELLTRQPDIRPANQVSLLPLPFSYVVPGGRFREVYYWDSYFTMLGLRAHSRWDLIENMVDNFAHLIQTYGFVPNGNRSYYLGRSQPPFFSLMVRLLSEKMGKQTLLKYLPAMILEYLFWTKGTKEIKYPDVVVDRLVFLPKQGYNLNRYWDEYDTPRPESYREDVELSHQSKQSPPQLYRNLRAAAESGWDFSSRWFPGGGGFESICTTDILPIDLNCLLWHLEQAIADGVAMLKENDDFPRLQKLADNRRLAIRNLFWDDTDGFFFDYNFKTERTTNKRTLAAVFPLFFQLASQEQANQVANIIELDFLKPGGLATTLENTGQQWDAPNGWAPLQWIAYKGLKNYGHDRLAGRILSNWLNTVSKVYENTGKMTEKYNVFNDAKDAGGGEYPNQDGFGWTNGVFLAMNGELKTEN